MMLSIEPASLMSSEYMRTFLPRQLLLCVCLSIFGWYAPDKLIRPIIGITMKQIPYQLLSSGDIVLDQSLNYDVVHSTTIPCKLQGYNFSSR